MVYVSILSNQEYPMVQILSPLEDASFQDDNCPIYTAGPVQIWFEEHLDEITHLPRPSQFTDHFYCAILIYFRKQSPQPFSTIILSL
ncbi:hypothetical protein NPIL_36511 [Nephila pilipes]|uniref:Uncharacterized protein n=1 Tax=Nephila pilipes TaxID=299642 RepID=A0A8X6U530_NEPPI|nr:hypothetical protein NPIL_36511 [Nephila pilipes]